MRLIIFKPAYYSKYHSVDDLMPVLYKLCEFVNEKKYSSIIDKIMIGPIIAPQDEIKTGKWFEVVKCWKKSRDASISKQIDYNLFINSSLDEKIRLLIINVLESIKLIEKKGAFDYISFEKDVITFCKLHGIDLQN